MKYQFTPIEQRIIGCLLEKQVTTPDQYPLSLNSLVTACNQKSNREPVLELSERELQDRVDGLVSRHFIRTAASGSGSRVIRYEQRFCNSEFGNLKLSAPEVALVTTLLLRGPQTPGELRSRCSRMFEFSDMASLEQCLEGLAAREDGPFVVRLAREPGKRESRYAHLFSDGDVPEMTAAAAELPAESALAERLASLEETVTDLQTRLAQLEAAFHQKN